MRTALRCLAQAFILALFASAPGVIGPTAASAQILPRLFEAGEPGARPAARLVRPHQARKARLRLSVLDQPALVLNLFDNAERVATRVKVERHGKDRAVWHGRTDDGGIATFAVVRGVATGTVFLDGRSFEITSDGKGAYDIAELNAAAFPAELDPVGDFDLLDTASEPSGTSGAATLLADGLTEIDVMVLWTPAARNKVGGTVASIESLVLASVANTNLSYESSGVNARLRLVHAAEVAFTEAPTNIHGDLGALSGTTDGRLDHIHALRNEHAADIVTLIGSGYVSGGTCGVGYLMQSASVSFASMAFNVIDQQCAAGYLSYAHEVGHNQGLHHDPANTGGSTAVYPYAYGYQDPGGSFRTVLSYGSATRVPILSAPGLLYNGRPTGTSSQDNARALNTTAATVSAFRSSDTSTPPPPPPPPPACTFSVSTTSLSFQAPGGSLAVAVSASGDCSWTSSSSSWASVSGSGAGSGTATVTVGANSGKTRNTSVVVAGVTVKVSQAAPPKGNPGGKRK